MEEMVGHGGTGLLHYAVSITSTHRGAD